MKAFDYYITLIIIIKVCFILLSLYLVVLEAKHQGKSPKAKSVLFWKDHFEFIFTALMAVLLIYLFSPRNNRMGLIDNETKILLYLFGFVLLITANWDVFLGSSPLLHKIQGVIGR